MKKYISSALAILAAASVSCAANPQSGAISTTQATETQIVYQTFPADMRTSEEQQPTTIKMPETDDSFNPNIPITTAPTTISADESKFYSYFSEKDEAKIAEMFMQDLKNGDYGLITKLLCGEYSVSTAFEFLADVKIGDYKITKGEPVKGKYIINPGDDEQEYIMYTAFTVEFDASESSRGFSKGKNIFTLGINTNGEESPIAYFRDSDNPLVNPYVRHADAATDFANYYIFSGLSFDVPVDTKVTDFGKHFPAYGTNHFDQMCEQMFLALGNLIGDDKYLYGNKVSAKEFTADAEEYLGVKGVDFTDYRDYDKTDDTLKVQYQFYPLNMSFDVVSSTTAPVTGELVRVFQYFYDECYFLPMGYTEYRMKTAPDGGLRMVSITNVQ